MTIELKELFNSEVLNEETQKVVEEAINTKIEEAREEERNKLDVEYSKLLDESKNNIRKELLSLVDEQVKEEVSELKEDIEYYAKLDVKYAQELYEFKEDYTKTLDENMKTLVDQQVKEEISELKEDINEAKKAHFANQLFESFKSMYDDMSFSEAEKNSIEEMKTELETIKQERDQLSREKKIDELCSELTGKNRNIMEHILSRVPTDNLEEKYEKSLNLLVSENTEHSQQNRSNVSTVVENIDKNNVILEDKLQERVSDNTHNMIMRNAKRVAGIK